MFTICERPMRMHKAIKEHYSSQRESIKSDNLFTLRQSIIAFEIILLLCTPWAVTFFRNTVLNLLYIFYISFNLIFGIYVRRRCNNDKAPFALVQGLCMFFSLWVMSFAVAISVFPIKSDPSIFYSSVYIFMIIMFEIPPIHNIAIFTLVTVLFGALSCIFKTPYAVRYDITSAVISWAVGIIFLWIMTNMRLKNGNIMRKLEFQAQTDYLTGLANRRGMNSSFGMIYRHCLSMEKSITAIILDVDYFKAFNDRFGHFAGDSHLLAVGREISAFSEEYNAFAARYGGEEFALLLTDRSAAEISDIAQELLKRLRLKAPDGSETTVSIGVVTEIPKADGSFEMLLERADKALYRAKREGRNRVVEL